MGSGGGAGRDREKGLLSGYQVIVGWEIFGVC